MLHSNLMTVIPARKFYLPLVYLMCAMFCRSWRADYKHRTDLPLTINFRLPKQNAPPFLEGRFCFVRSLTMTYFGSDITSMKLI